MRYLAVISVFFISVFSAAPNIEAGSTFALTFDCGDGKNLQLCLIDRFPPSKTVTLLGGTGSDVCMAKTLGSFNYSFGVSEEFPATRLALEGCRQTRQYKIAFVEGKVSGYKAIILEQEKSKEIIGKANSIIRRKNLLQKADEEYYANTLAKMPVVYKLPGNSNSFLVQYLTSSPIPPNETYGPLYLFSNGTARIIDREAGISHVFTMNGRFFLLYDNRCWAGCGNIYTALVEIKGNQFKKIFENGAWAM